jgi:hypothetical protein
MMPNRSMLADRLLPHIAYRNLAEAIDWLRKTFGSFDHCPYDDSLSGVRVHPGNAWIRECMD